MPLGIVWKFFTPQEYGLLLAKARVVDPKGACWVVVARKLGFGYFLCGPHKITALIWFCLDSGHVDCCRL